MKNQSFETKQQYLAFRSAFAEAANAGKITSEDMIVLNAIRNKPLSYGFGPVTNANKLRNQCSGDPLFTFHQQEKYLTGKLSALSAGDKVPQYVKNWKAAMDATFQGTLTEEAWKMIMYRILMHPKQIVDQMVLHDFGTRGQVSSDTTPVFVGDMYVGAV